MMLRLPRHVVLALAFVALTAPARPQDGEEGWRLDVTGYVWIPETTTEVDTPDGQVTTVLEVDEALESLDLGVMLAVAARNGPWSIVADLIYLDLSAEESTPLGQLYSEATTDTTLAMLSGYGLYSVHRSEEWTLDLGLGLRAASSELDVRLKPGLLPGRRSGVDDDWVDLLVAGRLTGQLADRWSLVLAADGGGFGIGSASDETWQVVATVGYDLTQAWTLRAGWRHLAFERDDEGYEQEMSGLVVGVGYSF